MSQSRNTTQTVAGIRVGNTATLNNVRLNRSSVSQGSSMTSGVTINTPAGFIFTHTTGTLATGGSVVFAVTNTAVRSDSIVLSDIVNHGGAGIPIVRVSAVTEGSFNVSVRNIDLTNALTGSVRLAYTIL
jgi:hypothetical protein